MSERNTTTQSIGTSMKSFGASVASYMDCLSDEPQRSRLGEPEASKKKLVAVSVAQQLQVDN